MNKKGILLVQAHSVSILKSKRARKLGLIGAKAQVFSGAADWSSFFDLGLIMTSVGGLAIFGFIFVWIFGREFTERSTTCCRCRPRAFP